MNFWRAEYRIHGHSPHGPQLTTSSESDRVQTEGIENFPSSSIVTYSSDSAPDSCTLPHHVGSVTNSSPFTSSVNLQQNDPGDLEENVSYDDLAGQFQLVSTQPFQNSLCARHAFTDSPKLLSIESEPDLQVGVFVGAGLAQPIQAKFDETSRGLRRVGQLPLRKLKILREKKKEEELQKRKDAEDNALRTLTEMNKEPSGEPTVEDKRNVMSEEKTSDGFNEELCESSEKEAGHAAKTEAQDGLHEEMDGEPESQVQAQPDELQEPKEALIELGLSNVLFQPMNLAPSRFTEGQRKAIAMIDQMMEEMHMDMVWLGPSAWSEKV